MRTGHAGNWPRFPWSPQAPSVALEVCLHAVASPPLGNSGLKPTKSLLWTDPPKIRKAFPHP